jgi:ketosteroid isomerase-like protein
MSPEENLKIVRRAYEGASTRMEMSPELFAPDVELDVTEVSAEFPQIIRGREAAEEVLRDYWTTFEAFHVDLEEVIHADEVQVVTVVRDGGRSRGSDSEVWSRFFHVWDFDDGRIVRIAIYTERHRAIEAAGLRE